MKQLAYDAKHMEGLSYEEQEYLKDIWQTNIVGVLEVNPNKALKRAYGLAATAGVKTFRPYGHTQGNDIITTVRMLRKEFPNAEIIASQITNVEIAKACEAEGADGIIIGVGSGGRCTTADMAQLVPSNAVLAWKLRGEIGIPVIGEGGAVDEPIIAMLVGE